VTASAIDVIHFGWKSALVVSGVAAGVSLLKAVVKAQPADPADVPPVSVTPKFPGSSPLA
jgi:hypothetical protein